MEVFACLMSNVIAVEESLGFLALSVLRASPTNMAFKLALYRHMLPCVWPGV